MEMIGVPSKEVLSVSERKMKFFKQNDIGGLDPLMVKNSRGKFRKPLGKPLQLVLGDEDPDFTDFVIKCLEMDPSKRLDPDDALKHLWILKGLPP
jgi:dual specificity tyrosine-phosphorylation-regulated kinase 2/3/4